MSITFPIHLSDQELLDATARAAAADRRATAELVALLAELDVRRLFLGQGCASLFTFCTQVLHLSEHAAYHRIEAARAARQFPAILTQLTDGALTLTTIAMLRPQLTRENHARVLADARYKTKREVEQQVAGLAPRPDARPVVRRLPAPGRVELKPIESVMKNEATTAPAMEPTPKPRPPVIAPVAADRYVLKVTLTAGTHANLRRAQDLLRHTIPNGDPSAILDRALALLVTELERVKLSATSRPRPASRSVSRSSRHVPAAVKRAVWARDDGRCAFVGAQGRCRETGQLEFHHVTPFARGGPAPEANLALRCRAHNSFEGELVFGVHQPRKR